MITVQQALQSAVSQLREANIDGAARDARLLLAASLGVPSDRLTLHMYDEMDEMAKAAFFSSILSRVSRVPVSHLIGGRDFYGRRFKVTADVLDPRPDTESLIVAALSRPFTEFLDLGTGSGAIAVTLAAERPHAIGIASDLSPHALEVAKQNAKTHQVNDRIECVHSGWYQAIAGRFDLIVSNPPYIALDEMDDLQPEVRLHEPRMALTDEADGLSAYRIICRDAPAHLTPGGRLIVEIGPTQAVAVSRFMSDAGLVNIGVRPDLDGRDRVVAGEMPK
ncbi:peptide chain release factor N(5)-glutamine methyltransferase [Yoonia maritima]|uniref:peptide chain release factor N(5)-glutamine methyltransferase n=1 Tax=Yoonia maritima TaxID=1435347 RepID=UPI0031BABEC4